VSRSKSTGVPETCRIEGAPRNINATCNSDHVLATARSSRWVAKLFRENESPATRVLYYLALAEQVCAHVRYTKTFELCSLWSSASRRVHAALPKHDRSLVHACAFPERRPLKRCVAYVLCPSLHTINREFLAVIVVMMLLQRYRVGQKVVASCCRQQLTQASSYLKWNMRLLATFRRFFKWKSCWLAVAVSGAYRATDNISSWL